MKSSLLKTTVFSVLLLVLGIALAGCGTAGVVNTKAAAPETPAAAETNVLLVSEGKLVPSESINLAFSSGGLLAELLVKEGDTVKKGDLIAHLGSLEKLDAGIAAAELELANAHQVLDNLKSGAVVEAAAAQSAIAQAHTAVREAKYRLDNFTTPSNQAGLPAQEAAVAMRQALDRAKVNFDPYKDKSENDANRIDLKKSLDNAQADYNAAVRRLQLESDLAAAEAALKRAVQNAADLDQGINPNDLAVAAARVKAAEAALAAARAARVEAELVSPMAGTVVKVNVKAGEQVAVGQVVAAVANFDHWDVETDNLTELEVVNVQPGQKVIVVADALPGLKMNGQVEAIGKVFEEKRGDITYTVKIRLDKVDPRLLWGMTVAASFEK